MLEHDYVHMFHKDICIFISNRYAYSFQIDMHIAIHIRKNLMLVKLINKIN